MKKLVNVFVVAIIFVTIAVGCSHSEKVNPAIPQSTFTNSDNIKWDEVNYSLIDSVMKKKLKASIDAMVNKDIDAFHKTLGPEVGTAHDYLLDHSVIFQKIDEVHKEYGRILVHIKGDMQNVDQSISEIAYTFYFEKDKNSEWQIVSID